MLILTRKVNQALWIGDNITIVVCAVKGKTVQLGIEAPQEVVVLRAEVREREQSADTVETAKTKKEGSDYGVGKKRQIIAQKGQI
ncbi:MAG TPA: carbon storage regulator [Accumulibacter sp.]|nr:carbon storage regulator [Accumulibacter sp.]